MKTTFKIKDGYSTKDFLHYGIDHCQTSIEILTKFDARSYDSAAYLFHLGLEQILKAWHLEVFGEFISTHHIINLIKKLKGAGISISLDESEDTLISEIHSWFENRYPSRTNNSIGNEDTEEMVNLVNHLFAQMPNTMQDMIEEIDPTRKGGRILMEKPED